MFFFGKKNQKNFSFGSMHVTDFERQGIKVFCFFFFKKEVLSSL